MTGWARRGSWFDVHAWRQRRFHQLTRCVDSVLVCEGLVTSLAAQCDMKSVRGSEEANLGYEGKRKLVEYNIANRNPSTGEEMIQDNGTEFDIQIEGREYPKAGRGKEILLRAVLAIVPLAEPTTQVE